MLRRDRLFRYRSADKPDRPWPAQLHIDRTGRAGACEPGRGNCGRDGGSGPACVNLRSWSCGGTSQVIRRAIPLIEPSPGEWSTLSRSMISHLNQAITGISVLSNSYINVRIEVLKSTSSKRKGGERETGSRTTSACRCRTPAAGTQSHLAFRDARPRPAPAAEQGKITLTLPKFETVEYSVEDGTAWIRLNRPEVLNAFSSRMYGDLKNALRTADHDNEIDTIAITGTGKAFGTGGDLKELLECLDNPDPLAIYRFDDALPFDVLRRTRKTTFAVVNGICVAGGLMITLMCDFSIASESASFGAPEGRVGFADAFLPSLLYGRVSMPRIKYLLYTGKSIPASQAVELGLITMAVSHDELLDSTRKLISEVRETSPLSRKLYKSYLDRLLPPAHIDDSHPAMRSPEAISRLKEFANKRKS